ncbi:HAD hydrolase-like protein [Pontiella sulfatireligans]|uniref:Pyrophosphatase PpaX n=1 Tax=Pontiella sulfatireligans TaxID=2750658 RepID=A0A6C2UV70_9BACT|nr:HAD hydrolase-like protein [Pontiella sulfatireligans]VGO23291.1 Pyrophosphatase PpaX [Pontiella sulfatireligans]
MSESKTTILFDFDGTLAETMMLIYKVFNRLSSVYGYRRLPEDEIETVRHLNMLDFIAYTGIPRWKVPIIAIHARRLMHSEIHAVHPPAGLVEVLTEIHESGAYCMDILTSNRRKNVLKFLAEHSMGWFDEVHTTRAILSKKRRVEKYIRHNGLDPQKLYYIGDTSVDVESARHAGAKVIAVSWGLNTAEALARCNPDHLVDHPSQLLDIFPAG